LRISSSWFHLDRRNELRPGLTFPDDSDTAAADTKARRSVQLLETLLNCDGREWFWLACACTTLAAASHDASGRATSGAQKLADRAMADLCEAVAQGLPQPARLPRGARARPPVGNGSLGMARSADRRRQITQIFFGNASWGMLVAR
jgi:hypothetical protein